MILPKAILAAVGERPYKLDEIGMSGSQVLIFDDMVLKVQPESAEAQAERSMLDWLRDKLPVPEIYAHEMSDGRSYLLMSRLQGKMCCDLSLINDPKKLVTVLCDGLNKLWSTDISDCPVNASLDRHLAAAEYNVKNGLVDLDNVEPDTFGENGFRDPEHLLNWLQENRPVEELVLSHGDYCLPNVFADESSVCGYLDLGRAGVADKYRDIAICYRSLKSNLRGSYGDHPHVEFDVDELFRKLDITPDWEKIRYYILLDELF